MKRVCGSVGGEVETRNHDLANTTRLSPTLRVRNLLAKMACRRQAATVGMISVMSNGRSLCMSDWMICRRGNL